MLGFAGLTGVSHLGGKKSSVFLSSFGKGVGLRTSEWMCLVSGLEADIATQISANRLVNRIPKGEAVLHAFLIFLFHICVIISEHPLFHYLLHYIFYFAFF